MRLHRRAPVHVLRSRSLSVATGPGGGQGLAGTESPRVQEELRRISLRAASRLAAAGLVVMTVAPPVLAHVVEAAASIPSEHGEDRETLDRAIQSAIDDLVAHAIAFEPTIVSLLDAKVVGDRIYLFVLIAGRDGEGAIRLLLAGRAARRPGAAPAPREPEASYRL